MSQLPRYESYKDSGVQWLGEVPSHWAVKKLKFLTSYFKGFAFKSEDFSDIGIPLIKASNVKKFSIENVESHIAFEKVQDAFDRVKLQEGDLILSTVGSLPNVLNSAVGQIAYVSPDFAGSYLNQNNVCFRSNEKVLPIFLKYFVMSSFFRRYLDVKALWIANQAYLEVLDVQNISIIFPDLDEQKIIADFLDKRLAQVDTLIAKQETLLEKLAEQRVALISHAVTKGLNSDVEMKDSGVEWLGKIPNHWKTIRIKFLGDIVLGLTYSPEDVTTSESGTLVLRSSNVQKGVLVLNDNVYVEKSIPKKMVTTDQDILICSRNGSRSLIGKCALIEGEGVGQTFGAFMTVFRSPYRKYLYYVLSSDLFKYQIGSFLTSTINQLTTYALGNFEIAFPLEKEQKKITDYLDKELAEIEKVKDNVGKTLRALKEYRSTLITQVVTGKIDVRNLKVN